MEYLNIQVSSDQIKTLGYNKTDSDFLFERDIVIKGWSVGSRVKHIMTNENKQSNVNNYLEFVISDNNYNQRVIRYYYYCLYDSKGNISWEVEKKNIPAGMSSNHFTLSGVYPIIQSVIFFLEHSSIFRCNDWLDFDAHIKKNK